MQIVRCNYAAVVTRGGKLTVIVGRNARKGLVCGEVEAYNPKVVRHGDCYCPGAIAWEGVEAFSIHDDCVVSIAVLMSFQIPNASLSGALVKRRSLPPAGRLEWWRDTDGHTELVVVF